MLRHTVIVPIGLLLDLNHNATGAAFIKLAQEPERMPTGEKLDPAQLNKLMPQILAVDANFRAGKCDPAQFRKEILSILKLKASDEEFDKAWNAMLGNLEKLSSQLSEIKRQNEHVNIIWISKTNPIHIKAIFNSVGAKEKKPGEATDTPMLLGHPFFASCHSRILQTEPSETADIAFYQEIMRNRNLSGINTTLVLQCTSNSSFPHVKKRDEGIADGIKRWGVLRGFNIIDRSPTEEVTFIITERMRRIAHPVEEKVTPVFRSSPAERMENFVKNGSGKVRFWGASHPESLEDAVSRHEARSSHLYTRR